MSPYISVVEGFSLLTCGVLLLFTLRRRGKNRLLLTLAWLFITAGGFRLSMFLPGLFGYVSGGAILALISGIVTSVCIYFGLAAYMGQQVGFFAGARAGRSVLWVGISLASILMLYFAALAILPAALVAPLSLYQGQVMIWSLIVSFLLVLALAVYSVIQAKRAQGFMVSSSVMNIGLGLLILAWILQKTVQTAVPAEVGLMFSYAPFLSVIVVLIAIFLQSSITMTPGVVYNAKNRQSIPLAIVRLYRSADKKLLETRVTSKTGRYGILVEPGMYVMEVEAKGYRWNKGGAMGYSGEMMTTKGPSMIGFDIYLDPVVT